MNKTLEDKNIAPRIDDKLLRQQFLAEAFSRNIGLLTKRELEHLAQVRVAIPGMGGVGGIHLITLARLGIGQFHCADFDRFEVANCNRQYGADTESLGQPKLKIMKQKAQLINPYLEIREFSNGLTLENLDEFLEGVDVVVDSLDFFAFDIRRALFNRASKLGIYVITAGPIGFGCSMLIFAPSRGLSFDQYFDINEQLSPEQKSLRFLLGLVPKLGFISYMSGVNHKAQQGPSLGLSCNLCSTMAATEVLRIVLKRGTPKATPYYHRFDPYTATYCCRQLWLGNRHPLQRLKLWKMERSQAKIENSVNLTKPARNPNLSKKIHFLLESGIQAPSGDNIQPWRFSVGDNYIDVFCQKDSDDSFFNVDQVASLIAIGACIENIRLASAKVGLFPEIVHFPDPLNDSWCARITLSQKETVSSPLVSEISRRHTNREMYYTEPLSPAELRVLNASIADVPNCKLHLLSGKSSLDRIFELVRKADLIRLRNRNIHEHLHKMIRWKHPKKTKDGLPISTLCAGVFGELVLGISRPWWVANLLNKFGADQIIAKIASRGVKHCAGVGLLTVSGSSNEDLLRGGAGLQRVLLTISSLSMASQPMAALPLFFQRLQRHGTKAFLPTEVRILEEIMPEYFELFPEIDPRQDSQILLFRFGYPKKAVPRTQRGSLDEYLL